jgi:hypothetical protein
MDQESEISKVIAPEDLRKGDFVCVHGIVLEWLRCADSEFGRDRRGSATFLPFEDAEPRRVVSVCLPFVLVKDAAGKHSTMDIRRTVLARLSHRFGRKAFKRLAPASRPSCAQPA